VNNAIDLRGQEYFIDLVEEPALVAHLNDVIVRTVYEVARRIRARTGSNSVSVNRIIASFDPRIYIIGNCSCR
jgi:hypothetical protein